MPNKSIIWLFALSRTDDPFPEAFNHFLIVLRSVDVGKFKRIYVPIWNNFVPIWNL